jgi:hypothetical protein
VYNKKYIYLGMASWRVVSDERARRGGGDVAACSERGVIARAPLAPRRAFALARAGQDRARLAARLRRVYCRKYATGSNPIMKVVHTYHILLYLFYMF